MASVACVKSQNVQFKQRVLPCKQEVQKSIHWCKHKQITVCNIHDSVCNYTVHVCDTNDSSVQPVNKPCTPQTDKRKKAKEQ